MATTISRVGIRDITHVSSSEINLDVVSLVSETRHGYSGDSGRDFDTAHRSNNTVTTTESIWVVIFVVAIAAYVIATAKRLRRRHANAPLRHEATAAVRALVLALPIVALIWLVVGAPLAAALLAAAVLTVCVPLASPVPEFSSDALGAFLECLIWLPLFVLKQFVYGFPDRDELVLEPPAPAQPVPTVQPPAQTGVVVATLRPLGNVEIQGQQFSARSTTGAMVGVGEAVSVVGSDGQVVLVETTSED